MKKLRVGVDINGTLFFLERFPKDEEHAPLHDLLEEAIGQFECTEEPGVYLAEFTVTPETTVGPEIVTDAGLEIIGLEKLDV